MSFYVKKEDISNWANYNDRKSNYDDSRDIDNLIVMMRDNSDLNEYVKSFLPKVEMNLVSKPFGDYGVDIGIRNLKTGSIIGTLDVERWSVWKEDWPVFYNHIHFLGRKDKFLNQGIPFFMCYFNFNMSKVLVVSENTIEKFPTIRKTFKTKNVDDRVKEIPLSEGHIFGKNVTSRERKLFKYANAGKVISKLPLEIVGSTPTPRSTFPS